MINWLTDSDLGAIHSGRVVENRLKDEVEAEEASGGEGEEHQSVEQAESHFFREWEKFEVRNLGNIVE